MFPAQFPPTPSPDVRPPGTHRRFLQAGAWLAALLAICTSGPTSAAETEPDLHYRLTYRTEAPHQVAVELEWEQPLARDGVFVMPRAIPMGYGEQPYDRFVDDARSVAASSGTAPMQRLDGPRWQVPKGATGVRYQVDLDALEREVFSASDQSRRREGYVGVLGYSVFGYLEGRRAEPTRLTVETPSGWPVHATAAPRWPVETGPVTARTENFYALADSQVVMGPAASIRRLVVDPAPLYLVAYTEGPVDLERTAQLATTAYQRVIDYFVEVPFDHYTMHLELLEPISDRHEYGFSMEHLDSSTYYLEASRGLTDQSSAAEEARVLYNFAHHVVHSWVPKRAYGRGYLPFSWELAPVLDSIWFSEGFGQYAAIEAIAAGEQDPSAYRDGMLQFRFQSNLDSAPHFLREMTLVELSRVASTRYGQDFRTGRLVFSRGGLMAAAMDDAIRRASGGTRSLREALRFLVSWTAENPDGFRSIEELAELIQQGAGVDVRAVMERWLAPLPD